MSNVAYNRDCLEAMRGMDDNAFELAIVDPPYGISIMHAGGKGGKAWKYFERKSWDAETPSVEYFQELFRVSVNQIIWGANYFTQFLPASMGWVYWDKMNTEFTTSDGELAFTSFQSKLRTFRRLPQADKGFRNLEGGDIHPTQKPVALYKWLLQNYAKPGDKILDTHLGSGSSRIAAYDLGFDFTGYELDADYFQAQEERFARHTAQQTLFTPTAKPMIQEAMFV